MPTQHVQHILFFISYKRQHGFFTIVCKRMHDEACTPYLFHLVNRSILLSTVLLYYYMAITVTEDNMSRIGKSYQSHGVKFWRLYLNTLIGSSIYLEVH